ncbi:AAA family ATPase [Pseudomonas baetica]|uniref:AAA family ATPase n=1 Tax=Pseudomonas baetica TaxID=674054 RepID=UPI0024053A05|nr:AAA family ATPase [Pseudomonas baetica]MDF9779030.1 cell division protease FtsH [Pseudomonas baetica]
MSKVGFKARATAILRSRITKGILFVTLQAVLLGGLWFYKNHISEVTVDDGAVTTMNREIQKSDKPWTDHETKFSTFVDDMQAGKIAEAISGHENLYVTLKDGSKYAISDKYGMVTRQLYDRLLKETPPQFQYSEMTAKASPVSSGEVSPGYVVDMVMRVLFIVFILVSLYPMVQGFIPTRTPKKVTGVTFDDVIGCEEAKRALMDITRAHKNPEHYEALGAKAPRGVLMTGLPGTGKTQLAKALATECQMNFIDCTGSDFSSMWMGMGIMKVRSLFRQARRKAPCILFIDEIEGVGKRVSEPRFGESEQNRIINQFLIEMDGFKNSKGVFVIGATNLAESLDPALRREGRFDRTIVVPLPSMEDRKKLLAHYLGKLKNVSPMDVGRLASTCMGLTPAAIAAITNQAAILAAREDCSTIDERHVVDAIETHRIGEQQTGFTPYSAEDRHTIAVHEAGHAVIGALLKVGNIDKVTILPRGQALGVTLIIPLEDKRLHRKSELENRIVMLLAGRAAELVYKKETSSGAAKDLEEATRIALTMVSSFGMGPYSDLAALGVLREAGIEVDATGTLSLVNKILLEMDSKCHALLTEFGDAVNKVIEQLLKNETIDGSIVYQALGLPGAESQGEEVDHLSQAACVANETV